MKKATAIILAAVLLLCVIAPSAFAGETAVDASAWALTDGLGRTAPLSEGRREGKFVGMFYWLWHYPWCENWAPINNTEFIKEHPEAKYDFYNESWGVYADGGPQFWDEPLFGYYSNLDEYVLRKHAELLADADIDVIIFDCTNGTETFDEGFEALFRIWEEAKQDGVNVPQIAFILPFSDPEYVHTDLVHLYDTIYSEGRYRDLWFMWNGKPLIMADSSALNRLKKADREIYNFFTFRNNEATYFADDTLYSRYGKNTWGWCSSYPQTLFGKKSLLSDETEQICVSIAQNCNEYGLCAMNSAEGTVQGRSFAKGDYSYSYEYGGQTITVDKNTENLLLYGLNFQQQWDYAIEKDPDFIFITGFNEWIAGRFIEWEGTPNASPDQYDTEYSRDIEPSAGILKDYYYCQLAENVRRYKGTTPTPAANAEKAIDIDGDLSQWESVKPEYRHYTGSTRLRDSAGWKGTYYTNDTMRNDIVSAKVCYDEENIYFLVTTKDALSPQTDNAWMRLFIDTDSSGSTPSWEGFEYIINRESDSTDTVTVEKSLGGWSFTARGSGRMSVSGNTLQFEIPRDALGLDNTGEVKFNFKWSDNMQNDGEITDFYTNGDVAPGGRFTFVFDSSADGKASGNNDGGIKTFLDILRSKIKAFTEVITAMLKKAFSFAC